MSEKCSQKLGVTCSGDVSLSNGWRVVHLFPTWNFQVFLLVPHPLPSNHHLHHSSTTTSKMPWAVCILEDALCVWTNLGKHSLFVWLFVFSVKTGTRRIIRLDELSYVVQLKRRTTEDSSSERIMRLVPVFTLETNNQTNNECLPKFVQTHNASSSIKTAILSLMYGILFVVDIVLAQAPNIILVICLLFYCSLKPEGISTSVFKFLSLIRFFFLLFFLGFQLYLWSPRCFC